MSRLALRPGGGAAAEPAAEPAVEPAAEPAATCCNAWLAAGMLQRHCMMNAKAMHQRTMTQRVCSADEYEEK